MSPQLLHLFGPLYINVYGLFIAIGLFVGISTALFDKKLFHIIDQDTFFSFIFYTMIAAVAGGRLLFVLEKFKELPSFLSAFKLWEPGYSILGAIVVATGFSWYYLKQRNINPVTVLDRIAIYVPLVQSIARLGCYFAGCCYGLQTTVAWAVIYTHPDNLAPLHIALHPTQLYSSFLLFSLFVVLYRFQNFFKYRGQLLSLYLIGAGLERFIVDFLRANRKIVMGGFSSTQLVAVAIVGTGLTLLAKAFHAKRKQQSF